MDYIIREVEGVGYLPIVLDQYSNEVYRGEYHHMAYTALDSALVFVEDHFCADCGMHIDDPKFINDHPEAIPD